MNTLSLKPLAKNICFDSDTMTVELIDGRALIMPLVYFPRLLNATSEQRSHFTISGGGIGLHWDDIDEDINVEYLMMGYVDGTHPGNLRKAA